MARKKKKTKNSWFGFGSGKKKTKIQLKQRAQARRSTFMIFAALVIFAAIGLALVFLERYINSNPETAERTARLELLDEPYWVNAELREKIATAAMMGLDDLSLGEDTARIVAENLETMVWLDDTMIKVTNEAVQISGRYRKPLALIENAGKRYYVDDELVLLDYVTIDKLAIVEIKGIGNGRITRSMLGNPWLRDDVAAAVTLLELLNKMDAEVAAEQPLLDEIASIDVRNYNGRKSARKPHIILYARDGTEIFWGAEKGKWHLHLEAKDEEKLALLYNTYEAMGTLQLRSSHKGNFIDLTNPQKSLSLPIDRY